MNKNIPKSLKDGTFETSIYDKNRIISSKKEWRSFYILWTTIKEQEMIECTENIFHPAFAALSIRSLDTLLNVDRIIKN